MDGKSPNRAAAPDRGADGMTGTADATPRRRGDAPQGACLPWHWSGSAAGGLRDSGDGLVMPWAWTRGRAVPLLRSAILASTVGVMIPCRLGPDHRCPTDGMGDGVPVDPRSRRGAKSLPRRWSPNSAVRLNPRRARLSAIHPVRAHEARERAHGRQRPRAALTRDRPAGAGGGASGQIGYRRLVSGDSRHVPDCGGNRTARIATPNIVSHVVEALWRFSRQFFSPHRSRN